LQSIDIRFPTHRCTAQERATNLIERARKQLEKLRLIPYDAGIAAVKESRKPEQPTTRQRYPWRRTRKLTETLGKQCL